MITLQDCIAICGLDEAVVLAIAEHEHVPEVVATGIADCLMKQRHGAQRVRHMIIEDVQTAHARGDQRHVAELLHCLKEFLNERPEADPGSCESAEHSGI